MTTELRGRAIKDGQATGRALCCAVPISFFGGVDPDTGVVTEKGHPLEGQCIAGRVLVFPHGKGSTVGSYALLRLQKNGAAPAALVNRDCETIVAVGAIIAGIPCVDQLDLTAFVDGVPVVVDGARVVIG